VRVTVRVSLLLMVPPGDLVDGYNLRDRARVVKWFGVIGA